MQSKAPHRRNLATELATLEEAAQTAGADLVFFRKREPIPHWAVQIEGPVEDVQEIANASFLDLVTEATALIRSQPTDRILESVVTDLPETSKRSKRETVVNYDEGDEAP